MMEKYKCKKSFCVDKYDEDGALIENVKGQMSLFDDGFIEDY